MKKKSKLFRRLKFKIRNKIKNMFWVEVYTRYSQYDGEGSDPIFFAFTLDGAVKKLKKYLMKEFGTIESNDNVRIYLDDPENMKYHYGKLSVFISKEKVRFSIGIKMNTW